MQEESFFDALHYILSWANWPEVLDHLFAKLLFVQHLYYIMNKSNKIYSSPPPRRLTIVVTQHPAFLHQLPTQLLDVSRNMALAFERWA